MSPEQIAANEAIEATKAAWQEYFDILDRQHRTRSVEDANLAREARAKAQHSAKAIAMALYHAVRVERETEPTPEEKIAVMLTAELAKEPGRVIGHYLFLNTREHVPREQWELLKTACFEAAVAHNKKVK